MTSGNHSTFSAAAYGERGTSNAGTPPIIYGSSCHVTRFCGYNIEFATDIVYATLNEIFRSASIFVLMYIIDAIRYTSSNDIIARSRCDK